MNGTVVLSFSFSLTCSRGIFMSILMSADQNQQEEHAKGELRCPSNGTTNEKRCKVQNLPALLCCSQLCNRSCKIIQSPGHHMVEEEN